MTTCPAVVTGYAHRSLDCVLEINVPDDELMICAGVRTQVEADLQYGEIPKCGFWDHAQQLGGQREQSDRFLSWGQGLHCD